VIVDYAIPGVGKMLSDKDKEVARKIGQFYLQKNNRDYKATALEIATLGINEIKVREDGVVEITAERVGPLIGRRASNLNELIKFLDMKLHIKEDPDPLSSYLIPQDWEENYYDDDAY
jgi:hypothetical protein